jgi:hypothetical protein
MEKNEIKPHPKAEIFTEKPRTNPSQDIKNKAKEVTEKKTRFNNSEMKRKIKKSAVHYQLEN